MIEKFSSKNCMPCRLFSPIFDSIYELNKERIILIEYTSSVPSPGGFYLLNTRDNSSREIFYGIGGVPWVFCNGKSLATADFNSATIDSIQKKSYEIQINFKAELNVNKDSLFILSRITSNVDIDDSLQLIIVLTDKKNHHQLRQIVNTDDLSLHNALIKNQSHTKLFKCELMNRNKFLAEDIEIIVFVQSIRTKRIYGLNHSK